MNEELAVGLKVRGLLDQSADSLPDSVKARLNDSVRLAVAAHARQKTAAEPTKDTSSFGHGLLTWLSRHLGQPSISFAVSACFVAAAGFGVAVEMQSSQEEAVMELTTLDAAILADDLPTDAWLDPGFVSYSVEMRQRSVQDYQRMNEWLQSLDQDQPNT